MAIDTATKRFSIMDYDQVFMPALSVPDNTFDASDREHSLWLYALSVGLVFTGLMDVKARKRFDTLDVFGRGHVDVMHDLDALDVFGRGHVDIRDRTSTITVKRHGG